MKYGLFSGTFEVEAVEVAVIERLEELLLIRGRMRGMGPCNAFGFVRRLFAIVLLFRGVGRLS